MTTLLVGGLVLRPPAASDAAEALALVLDPDVRHWNPCPAVVDLASARAWCQRGGDWTTGDHATFTIEAGAAYAGNVSLHSIDSEQSSGSIGYRIAPAHRGRGIATAAVDAVTSFAFAELGLVRVQLLHAVPNEASCRVAVKAGFAHEGTLRSSGDYDGVRHDEHVHGRLCTDVTPAVDR